MAEAPVAKRTLITGFIYSFKTILHKTGKSPVGINVLWGDGHVSFSNTPQAFDPAHWDVPTGSTASSLNPGDNPNRFRTIVGFLRP